MIWFCQRVQEAERVLLAMAGHGRALGVDGLKIYVMRKIPNNVIQIDAGVVSSLDFVHTLLGA